MNLNLLVMLAVTVMCIAGFIRLPAILKVVLDHRYRVMEFQDQLAENSHRRYLEADAFGREPDPVAAEIRRLEAATAEHRARADLVRAEESWKKVQRNGGRVT